MFVTSRLAASWILFQTPLCIQPPPIPPSSKQLRVRYLKLKYSDQVFSGSFEDLATLQRGKVGELHGGAPF